MNSWTSRATLLVFLTGAACSAAPPAQPASSPARAPVPVADQAPRSDAIARADALLEDLKRRQEAQDKYDREHPLPPAMPLPGSLPAARPGESTVVPPSAASNWPGVTPNPQTPARDEKWWRDQMQSLELKLNEELIRLAAAEKANLKYGYNDAQAQYKQIVAAVANARLAIEKLQDEARRAGVPPGWLR